MPPVYLPLVHPRICHSFVEVHVPNFVPEPIRVEGCVADEPWARQVAFLKQVITQDPFWWMIILFVFWKGQIALGIKPELGALATLFILFLCRQAPHLVKWSVQIVLAFWLGNVAAKFQIWSPFYAAAFSFLYAVFARRDYSRFGHFLYAFIATLMAIAWVTTAYHMPPATARLQALVAFVFLLHRVIDLAAITYRRSYHETVLAGFDLFRDVLNGFIWIKRIAEHLPKLK